ncbi:hypothetical protein [Terrihabitans sp. B22-R8]|uniref:hypothetical protein n=1 Tax=Terrihabitans sp. B22-R8 TaxID=3425128 RepID=UPI00403C16CD
MPRFVNNPRTVQDFIDMEMGLFGWCDVCQSSVNIDLHRLGTLKGFDLDLYQRQLPIKCARCDTRVTQFRVKANPLSWRREEDG